MSLTTDQLNSLIHEARTHLGEVSNPLHGIEHTEEVIKNLNRLVPMTRKDGIDYNLLMLCGWWHDTGWLSADKDVEQMSFEMLKEVFPLYVSDVGVLQKCEDIIVTSELYDGYRTPQEGILLQDAIKLSWLSPVWWKYRKAPGAPMSGVRDLLPRLRDEMLLSSAAVELYDTDIVKLVQFLA